MLARDADLSHPAAVMKKLEEIEQALAHRQNALEDAARRWYTAKREIEREKARALLTASENTVTEKKAQAELSAYDVEDAASEAEYEAIKAAVRVLETRATVCQSLLRAQGRV